MPEFNSAPVESPTHENEADNEPEFNVEQDREFKAHIYQQLVDLQPYLSADSQVAVLVEQEGGEYKLTLVTTWGEYRAEAEGKNVDVYVAFGLAKRKMMQQLDEWYNTAIDSNEREAQIQSLLDGSGLIH